MEGPPTPRSLRSQGPFITPKNYILKPPRSLSIWFHIHKYLFLMSNGHQERHQWSSLDSLYPKSPSSTTFSINCCIVRTSIQSIRMNIIEINDSSKRKRKLFKRKWHQRTFIIHIPKGNQGKMKDWDPIPFISVSQHKIIISRKQSSISKR